MQDELWRHARDRCEARNYRNAKELEDESGEILILGRNMLLEETVDDPLLRTLFSKLQGDEVAEIVQEDEMGSP